MLLGCDVGYSNHADDGLIAWRRDNAISLGDHADSALGGRGNDCIEGGQGSDVIRGKRNRHVIDGGGGIDRCWGGRGIDGLTSCNETPPTSSVSATSLSTGELDMASLVNNLRSSYGRPGLKVSIELSGVARSWSRELTSEFRHNRDLGAELVSGVRAWGENIAIKTSVSTSFSDLVSSNGHFANMIDDLFTCRCGYAHRQRERLRASGLRYLSLVRYRQRHQLRCSE